MKWIKVVFSNGEVYKVPATIVAKDRANYYAKNTKDDAKEVYEEELQNTLNDDFEIIDWAQNNMNWEEVAEHAVRFYDESKIDFHKEWISNELDIIED